MLSHATPIVSFWIPKNVEDLLPESHVLPNTFKDPYRDNFINCAKQNPEKKIVFVALTTGLTEAQKTKAKSIEEESANILFIPLEDINFGEYDFSMQVEGSVMLFSNYLRNRHTVLKKARLPLAIEVDLIRIILGLRGCEFLIEAGIPETQLPQEKSLFISDCDILIQEKIENIKLNKDIALLEVYNKFEQLENGALIVHHPKHDILVALHEFIKDFFSQQISEDFSKITPNMIFTAQIAAFTAYFSSISRTGPSSYDLVETVKKDLIKMEDIIFYNDGAKNIIYQETYRDMMKSKNFAFKYNNTKMLHHDNELNSYSGWQESLYHTESEESKLKQAFYSKNHLFIKEILDEIFHTERFTQGGGNWLDYIDYKKFADYIKFIHENLLKYNCLSDAHSRDIFYKKLEYLFVESESIHEKLDFKVAILDCLLQETKNKDANYIVNLLLSLPTDDYFNNDSTLEKYFNVLLKHNMLENSANRNELLFTLIFKAAHDFEFYDKDFSPNLKKLESVIAKSGKFTQEEVSNMCSYLTKTEINNLSAEQYNAKQDVHK